MTEAGQKIFKCVDKSSCHKKSCTFCGKYDTCKNCEHSGNCHFEEASSNMRVPKCYAVLY